MSDTPLHTIAIQLPDETATAALGRRLGVLLRPGDLVALRGDLGAGKSALSRALIRSVTHEDAEVPSPTFTLVQTYDTAIGPVWHFDLYRLSGPDEVYELGWDDARAEAVALVEWPDRLGPLLPPDRVEVTMEHDGPDARRAILTGHGALAARMAAADWTL